MRTLKEDIQRTEMAERQLKSALDEHKLDNSDDTLKKDVKSSFRYGWSFQRYLVVSIYLY